MAAGAVALGAALPATRRFFADRRVSDAGRVEAIYHVAVRIRLATALANASAYLAGRRVVHRPVAMPSPRRRVIPPGPTAGERWRPWRPSASGEKRTSSVSEVQRSEAHARDQLGLSLKRTGAWMRSGRCFQ